LSLSTSTKPTERDIFDAYAKGKGLSGVEYYEQTGNTESSVHAATSVYGYAWGYAGRHRLYGETLLGYQNTQKSMGVGPIYYQDYTALPQWRSPTMNSSPGGYDLYLITHKQVEFKQSRASFVPMLAELSPSQGLVINPRTAKARGIRDGDEVYVESHNAITGETRYVKTRARYYNSIRPDTVSLSHHYGLKAHGNSGEQGPTPNSLFFSSEGYVQCTQDCTFHVKVRVFKA
jgi:anaerobic selenocysteine-containing dehydrogenase